MNVAQRTVLRIIVLFAVATCVAAAHAQTPYILGTWKFNAEASKVSGPKLQMHVRGYRLREDGVLIGVAVSVAPDGTPQFLQFAAKPDGKDYPEFETQTAAQYLVDRTPPPRTYSESPTADDHRIKLSTRWEVAFLFLVNAGYRRMGKPCLSASTLRTRMAKRSSNCSFSIVPVTSSSRERLTFSK